eukprot:jgi/Mesvir1/25389/Mv01428-RA.1
MDLNHIHAAPRIELAVGNSLYFGFGAMCNRIGMARRGVNSLCQWPARLEGFRCSFEIGGMATLMHAEGERMHGVLHELSPADASMLRESESGGNDMEEVQVIPYHPGGGFDYAPELVWVFVFKGDVPSWRRTHPQERYIRIIAAGCQEVGVEASWIEWLTSLAVVEDRRPEDWLRIDDSVAGRSDGYCHWSMDVVESYRGQEVVFVLGYPRQVVRIDYAPDDETGRAFGLQLFSGRDITYRTCRNLYEPLLPDAPNPEDIQPVHRQWVESMIVETWAGIVERGGKVTILGYLDEDPATVE